MILAINNLLLWLLFLIIVGNRKAIDIIINNETKEIEVINIFLPKQLDDNETKKMMLFSKAMLFYN